MLQCTFEQVALVDEAAPNTKGVRSTVLNMVKRAPILSANQCGIALACVADACLLLEMELPVSHPQQRLQVAKKVNHNLYVVCSLRPLH